MTCDYKITALVCTTLYLSTFTNTNLSPSADSLSDPYTALQDLFIAPRIAAGSCFKASSEYLIVFVYLLLSYHICLILGL